MLSSTKHELRLGDARDLSFIDDESVGLVLTSPPYWTLKEYNQCEGQLGEIEDYEEFLDELRTVWTESFRILLPGARLVVVVGDVLLSRRKHGRHRVIPLHADILTHCISIGFDALSPIIWHKISNVTHEVSGRGGGFLGKPYQPNAIIKNDIEYILMLRKPGGYRSPTKDQIVESKISKPDFQRWFRQIWVDVPGAKFPGHPAPFPEELALRLVQMFSFVNDTVVDPFSGTGTTMLAAMKTNRNSIAVEIDPIYAKLTEKRLDADPIATRVDTSVESIFALYECRQSVLV